MSNTRLDLPVVHAPAGRGGRPWWLAPLCTLIVGSPLALAAGAGVAWWTNPDPTLAWVQTESPDNPPPFTPTPAAPTTTSAAETTTETTTEAPPPRTPTRRRTPTTEQAPPPKSAARTPGPTTTRSAPASSSSAPSSSRGLPPSVTPSGTEEILP